MQKQEEEDDVDDQKRERERETPNRKTEKWFKVNKSESRIRTYFVLLQNEYPHIYD